VTFTDAPNLVGSDGVRPEFIEALRIQCGLRARGCPEDSIRLSPRFVYDADRRNQLRTLNEASMAACVACGRPFLPRVLLERVLKLAKSADQMNDQHKRLIETCPDCRAKATMEKQFVRPP